MHTFDSDEAKKHLIQRQEKEKERLEQERTILLQKAISVLTDEFKGSPVEVYLVGSITRPYHFTSSSDIDIVLKNFKGDRFEIWTKLEEKLRKQVEIILFETCSFQDFVISQGYKVL